MSCSAQRAGGGAGVARRRHVRPALSCGVPSLDHVLGGSIQVGSVFLIEEDVLRSYSRVLSKYFLAEGVVCKHALFVASIDEDPKEIINELPVPTAGEIENEPKVETESDKLKIAWRYENQGAVESSFGVNTNFGHHFDLSRRIDAETLKNSNITCWNKLTTDYKIAGFHNPLYYDLLKTISNFTKKDEYNLSNTQNQNVLRICISSLGSPLWNAHENEEGFNPNNCGHDIMQFMFCLRVMLRNTTAVALVTVPSHLFEDEHIIKRLHNSVDNAVKLESFAGSDRETNPVFKDYHGLFHITKLSAVNTLVPYLPPSLDLAFKLRRKKFIIEKLHLPPELQESSEREQDDITAQPTCGIYKKKDIDF